MRQLDIRRQGTRVHLLVGGREVLDCGWEGADLLAAASRSVAAEPDCDIVVGAVGGRMVAVRRLGDRGQLLVNGQVELDAPARLFGVEFLAGALIQQARDAEEQAKAEQVAADAALLLRTGAPFGFTSDPKIRDEAGKQAAHDRTLRRALPGGIKSKEMFGRPAVIGHDTPRLTRRRS